MLKTLQQLLNRPFINEWRLFWLVSLPVSGLMVLAALRISAWDGPAVSSLIQLSVRMAVPFLYLTFAASSLQVLFPHALSRWLLRNRKIIGLCFAMAMAWQGFFILWLVTVYRDYYVTEVYVLRDAIEGTVGYAFLLAMTLTSFQFGRQRLSPKAWRKLHKFGIYYLWAYAYSVYWWEIFYYPGPEALDYVYFLMGFTACALRFAAWRRKQLKKMANTQPGFRVPYVFNLAGSLLVLLGLAMAATSARWREPAENLLSGHAFTHIPNTYLPYWPFEPFFPLMLIGLAAWLASQGRAPEQPSPLATKA